MALITQFCRYFLFQKKKKNQKSNIAAEQWESCEFNYENAIGNRVMETENI